MKPNKKNALGNSKIGTPFCCRKSPANFTVPVILAVSCFRPTYQFPLLGVEILK